MTTPSGTPDELGPDATPEQDALVRGLLGGLRADDPPMPDHVVARLDAALAEERRTASAAGLGASSSVHQDDQDASAAPRAQDAAATVTVLPQQRRRQARSTTALQWLVGAAAAVLVVGGAGAVISGTFGGTSSDTAASGGLSESAQERVVASGTSYAKDTLAQQVQALVADPGAQGEGSAPALAPEGTDTDGAASPDTGVDPGGTRAPAAGALSATALEGCVLQLAGVAGVEPVLVDQADYQGRAALVVVLVTPEDPQTLDVFVVSTDCDRDSGDVYEFQRIAAP